MNRILLLIALTACFIGCSRADQDRPTTITLNWKPEPEFGGIYEAQRAGLFEKHGLNVRIAGGPGAPTVSMTIAGQTNFAIASADELVMARAKGEDIVAVFATYQTCPQGLMVHKSRGLRSIGEIFSPGEGTVAMEPGLSYTKFLEAKYGFRGVKVVPYNYSIAAWLSDPKMTVQCFVFAEPIAARKFHADPQVFLIADTGYNPYTAIVVTRGETARKQPDKVKGFVAALRAGWAAYLADPKPANELMGRLNTEMDAETFQLAAESQVGLIHDASGSIGGMTVQRWQELIDQLHDLKLIDRKPEPASCFVDADKL